MTCSTQATFDRQPDGLARADGKLRSHIFSATLTNEFVAAWGYASSPYQPTNLSAAYKTTLGYPYGTIYA